MWLDAHKNAKFHKIRTAHSGIWELNKTLKWCLSLYQFKYLKSISLKFLVLINKYVPYSSVAQCIDSAIPRTAAHQASLSFTISQSLLILMSIELTMPSNHLILLLPNTHLLHAKSCYTWGLNQRRSSGSCPWKACDLLERISLQSYTIIWSNIKTVTELSDISIEQSSGSSEDGKGILSSKALRWKGSAH